MTTARSTGAPRRITCAHVLGPDGPMPGAQVIALHDGKIQSIALTTEAAEPIMALPALVNAHDHGRAVRTSSIGADAKPLESWIHYLALFPAVDPYVAACVAFASSALGGAGIVMNHYTRVQGFTDLPTELAEVSRAARDVGVRTGLAVAMRDRNPLVYGPSEPVLAALPPDVRAEIAQRFTRPPLSPRDYMTLVDEIVSAADGPTFDVQYGPNGVQWCSDALLQAIAEASARTGRRVHMHLLETKYQRQWCDANYPGGVVRMLDEIGLLSPRLTLAHCVWARPDELELLAERGVVISVNTSSNLHLHSGLAPMTRMWTAGCRIALGIDGKAFDDDNDALRELRLSHLLHAGSGFDQVVTRHRALHESVSNGRFAVTNIANDGGLRDRADADMLLLDWNALNDDALRSDLDPINLLFSRATARHIREVIVAGHTIVRDGHVAGIDFTAARQEILAQMRAGMPSGQNLAGALAALDGVIAASLCGCC
ncbi:cytosine/adenosine deaminase-related metal-dependent hydrolase [Tardiphaga robiniae]|uniref:amidohydrolase family protein n=1 Tax=Tardiphaga robiniae TaxID=943830 RepID=UPI00286277FF|nr:amidohydrolase family protein [Tardiphaga robiniae]MDR6657700.1 cytosine/adenosine deaminase-related metal-dependent hydrolase [Tardiphaga robiniae]